MTRSTTWICPTRYFASATVFLLVAFGTTGTSYAADECLAKPDSQAPRGSHWYYRLDRATQRKCWYVAAEGERVVRRDTALARRQSAKPPEPQSERKIDIGEVATPTVADEGREPRLPPRLSETSESQAETVMTGPGSVSSVRRPFARQVGPQAERSDAGYAAAEVDGEHQQQTLPRWSDAGGSRSGIAMIRPGSAARRDAMSAQEDGSTVRPMRDARVAMTNDVGDHPSLGIEYMLGCLAGVLAIAGLLAGRVARRVRPPVRIRPDLVPTSVLMPSPPLAGDFEGAPWRKLPAIGSNDDHRAYAPARYGARSRWEDGAEAAGNISSKASIAPRRGDDDLESKLQRLLHDWTRAAA